MVVAQSGQEAAERLATLVRKAKSKSEGNWEWAEATRAPTKEVFAGVCMRLVGLVGGGMG